MELTVLTFLSAPGYQIEVQPVKDDMLKWMVRGPAGEELTPFTRVTETGELFKLLISYMNYVVAQENRHMMTNFFTAVRKWLFYHDNIETETT